MYGEAVTLAPALRARFVGAGLWPGDRIARALNRLPVLKKERLMELQQAEPPLLAGYLACRSEEIGHIYASPGPIFEPSLISDPAQSPSSLPRKA